MILSGSKKSRRWLAHEGTTGGDHNRSSGESDHDRNQNLAVSQKLIAPNCLSESGYGILLNKEPP